MDRSFLPIGKKTISLTSIKYSELGGDKVGVWSVSGDSKDWSSDPTDDHEVEELPITRGEN